MAGFRVWGAALDKSWSSSGAKFTVKGFCWIFDFGPANAKPIAILISTRTPKGSCLKWQSLEACEILYRVYIHCIMSMSM